MKRGLKLTPAVMVIRMKGLPRRHRIAHLRALIAQQPIRSVTAKNCPHYCAMN